jgi:hypothetical protein
MTAFSASTSIVFAIVLPIIISCSSRIIALFLTLVKQIMIWYNLTMKLTEEIVMTAPTVKIGGDAVKVEEAPAETPADSEQPQE